MDDQKQPLPTNSTDPDKLSDKAAILESNLFSAVSKQDNPIVCRFQIQRETNPDPVIIKALTQLFPRLNIKSPKILLLIRKLLLREVPKGKDLKVQKKLFSLADSGNPDLVHLSVAIRALVTPEILAVEISGVPPIPGKDGAIEKAFFDYESCPGLVNEDGVIDFREINKYPIVKEGDNLFFIAPETQGRSGMQFDGKVIPVAQAIPMSFNLKDGVDKVDSLNKEEKSRGYFLRAAKTGVVVLTRDGDRITEMEVRDALDVNRLDYSTGNIGSKFICPISMKIDTICSGFSIRARGMVEVGELEGGEIETDDHATVHSVHPDSKITAKKDIVVHFSRNSALSSLKGRITVTDELVDTRADSVGIVFEKSRGILSGNVLDAEDLLLQGLYFCGENRIHFGCRLFGEKQSLIQDRAMLKKENQERKDQEKELLSGLHDDIKQLSKILKTNPLLRDNLRTFILATQNMDYETLYRELDIIGQTMNTKEVIRIKKRLDTLKQFPHEAVKAEKKDEALIIRIAETEKEMKKMRLNLEGYLRRAGTLKIFTPDDEGNIPDAPTLFIESKKDEDTFIKVQGKYTPHQGFQITQI